MPAQWTDPVDHFGGGAHCFTGSRPHQHSGVGDPGIIEVTSLNKGLQILLWGIAEQVVHCSRSVCRNRCYRNEYGYERRKETPIFLNASLYASPRLEINSPLELVCDGTDVCGDVTVGQQFLPCKCASLCQHLTIALGRHRQLSVIVVICQLCPGLPCGGVLRSPVQR